MFKLHSPFKPAGDQSQAIDKLAKNIKAGAKHQVFFLRGDRHLVGSE